MTTPESSHSGSATAGSEVLVSIEATCIVSGAAVPEFMKVEEYMSLAGILSARTLGEALEYFLSNTDVVSDIEDVRSFKVNGHEMLRTFIG